MNNSQYSLTVDGVKETAGSMSEAMFYQFTLANLVILSSIVSIPGVIFNLVIVVVFCKLGFKESSNVSLVGLAVADIGVLLTMIGYSVIYNPLLLEATPHLDIIDAVNYVVLGWPHILFSRIAGCLTTLVAMERFFCVALPLKVKTMITPRKTFLSSSMVYAVMVLSSCPAFVANTISDRWRPDLNISLVGLVVLPNSDFLEGITLSVNVFVELSSFTLVSIFTVALIRAFKKTSRWRNSSSSSSKIHSLSTRDKMLVKTVILISVVFIACSLPGVVGTMVMFFVKEFKVSGSEKFLFVAAFSVFFILGSINSSATIFIYFNMSSRFKDVLLSMLRLKEHPKSEGILSDS
ncbi:lysophosphatidic acid receptor 6 [Biomphalaria pfeifferi]|uniref:Lysophosphatidic acid receptor 6 n=1 Tax=Biomphalaria pfeifferi TaxID=112525 RepID=A0AAD8BTS0_BIOPF|nr:lysophosphatidic acid receptor 6 [Biomphalaria pfeifferi]